MRERRSSLWRPGRRTRKPAADLGTGADLGESIEANMIGYFATWGRMDGVTWIERDDISYLATGFSMPFLNRVLRANLPQDRPEEAINRLLAELGSHVHPLWWQVGPSSSPPDLARLLRKRGFVPKGTAPGMAMALPAKHRHDRGPADLAVERVDDEADLHDWFQPLAPEIGLPPEEIDAAVRGRREASLPKAPGFVHFLGRIRGRPVGSASLFILEDVAGIYDVATLPAWRRKGIGTALTLACLDEAHEAGLHVAVLQASRDAVHLYRRLGFRQYATFRFFESHQPWPPPAVIPS